MAGDAVSHERRRLSARIGVIAAACALAAAATWAGCSIEKDYKTLSLFFDGVPNPEARARAGAAGGITDDIRKSPTYSIHKPYKDDQCSECHSNLFKLTSLDSKICLKCHEKAQTEHPKMHGPVAAGACLWCHSPHESRYANLLKKAAPELCTQCHEPELLQASKLAEHSDMSRNCLECHEGHGGTAAYFLRTKEGGKTPDKPGEAGKR